MLRSVTRREVLCCALAAAATAGCGTILHPERRGQAAGRLDWKIVGLDAIGLIFFFVPGVIAFAVDFNNGSIYLPPEDCAGLPQPEAEQLTQVAVPREDLTLPGIETAVSQHAKTNVRLEPGRFETHVLKDIREFWPFQRRCAAA